jgi:hypothetical protein
VQELFREHEKLITRRNVKAKSGNGVYDQYANPVLTAEHSARHAVLRHEDGWIYGFCTERKDRKLPQWTRVRWWRNAELHEPRT